MPVIRPAWRLVGSVEANLPTTRWGQAVVAGCFPGQLEADHVTELAGADPGVGEGGDPSIGGCGRRGVEHLGQPFGCDQVGVGYQCRHTPCSHAGATPRANRCLEAATRQWIRHMPCGYSRCQNCARPGHRIRASGCRAPARESDGLEGLHRGRLPRTLLVGAGHLGVALRQLHRHLLLPRLQHR